MEKSTQCCSSCRVMKIILLIVGISLLTMIVLGLLFGPYFNKNDYTEEVKPPVLHNKILKNNEK